MCRRVQHRSVDGCYRDAVPGAGVPDDRGRDGRVTSQVRTIAHLDLRHPLRGRVVAGAVVLFALLVLPQLWTGPDPGSVATGREQVARIPSTFALPVLVLGVAVVYSAVAGGEWVDGVAVDGAALEFRLRVE